MRKTNNSDAFKIQKRLMTLAGFWPHEKPTFFYRAYGFTHYMMVATFAGSLLLSNIILDDFSQLIQSWSMFVAILNCSIKFTIFYFKMPALLNLLDFLHSPHFTYYEEEFDRYLNRIVRFAIFMVKLFFCSAVATVSTILLAPVLNSQQERQTPLPFPLDLKQHHIAVYYLVYTYQCIALSSAAWISVGFDNLSTSMMGLCSENIKNMVEDDEDLLASYGIFDRKINEKLCECVEHHLAIIKFTESIENIFTLVFLSQFLCSAAGICFVGFTFVNSAPGSLDFIFALSFLGTLMFQITLYCSYGNEVTIQSSRVRDACYMTEWIYCGPLVSKTIFLIMERSKRPLILTAGKFVNLSLESLVNVIRSAVSYAAVLLQLVDK